MAATVMSKLSDFYNDAFMNSEEMTELAKAEEFAMREEHKEDAVASLELEDKAEAGKSMEKLHQEGQTSTKKTEIKSTLEDIEHSFETLDEKEGKEEAFEALDMLESSVKSEQAVLDKSIIDLETAGKKLKSADDAFNDGDIEKCSELLEELYEDKNLEVQVRVAIRSAIDRVEGPEGEEEEVGPDKQHLNKIQELLDIQLDDHKLSSKNVEEQRGIIQRAKGHVRLGDLGAIKDDIKEIEKKTID